ncbi:MAG: nitroreductase family protein, partial [Deltaproteobacteria bacterium]|nr:nitroreductase family protein [Deltaproteobacteria bacterium]
SGGFRAGRGMPVPGHPQLCNRCGHCVAVCPADAVIHPGVDRSQVRAAKPKLLSPECFEEIVRTRRSVRRFKNQPVAKRDINRLLDLARYAPTATNAQDVGFIVVTDREVIRKIANRIFSMGKGTYRLTKTGPVRLAYKAALAAGVAQTMLKYMDGMEYYQEQAKKGRDLICHGAPVLILLHGPAGGTFSSDNCNIAGSVITHHAHALGLGTVYLGFVTAMLRFFPDFKRMLGLPKGRRVYATLALGHPKYRYARTVSRKSPRVTWVEP